MDIYKLIYSYCYENKKLLKRYKACTCLYCGHTFSYINIKNWVIDKFNDTAICPFCGIDAVVPSEVHNNVDNYKLTKELQQKIKELYF